MIGQRKRKYDKNGRAELSRIKSQKCATIRSLLATYLELHSCRRDRTTRALRQRPRRESHLGPQPPGHSRHISYGHRSSPLPFDVTTVLTIMVTISFTLMCTDIDISVK